MICKKKLQNIVRAWEYKWEKVFLHNMLCLLYTYYKENIDNIIGYIHSSEMFREQTDWTKSCLLYTSENEDGNSAVRSFIRYNSFFRSDRRVRRIKIRTWWRQYPMLEKYQYLHWVCPVSYTHLVQQLGIHGQAGEPLSHDEQPRDAVKGAAFALLAVVVIKHTGNMNYMEKSIIRSAMEKLYMKDKFVSHFKYIN